MVYPVHTSLAQPRVLSDVNLQELQAPRRCQLFCLWPLLVKLPFLLDF